MHWLQCYTDKETGIVKLTHPTSDLTYGNVIFNFKIGFNMIRKVNIDDSRFRIQFSRAGYPFSDGEFILKNVQFGNKSILVDF